MSTGACGCIWAYMGVMGCRGAGQRKNKTSTGKTGLAGYVRVACMAGKFPGKTHVCAHRHKGAMRDSGGWGWVRMGAGGCISIQQTQKKVKRVVGGRAGHNCGQAFGGGTWMQTWRGRHTTITEHLGVLGGTKGVAGGPHALAYRRDDKRARNNKKKSKNRQNNWSLQKWPKHKKRENNINVSKKGEKRKRRQNKPQSTET